MKRSLYIVVFLAVAACSCGSKNGAAPNLAQSFTPDENLKGIRFALEEGANADLTYRTWKVEGDEIKIRADITGDGRIDDITIKINYTDGAGEPELTYKDGYELNWPYGTLTEFRLRDVDNDGDADIVLGDPAAANGSKIFTLKNISDYPKFQAVTEDRFQEILRDIRAFVSNGQDLEAFQLAADIALGSPYDPTASGEGEDGHYDTDPEVDLTQGNCVTWVEQILAMMLADGSYDDFRRELQQIRYKDGVEGYGTRNHFQEIDWIPNNIRAGHINNILPSLMEDVPFVTATIDKKAWYEAKTELGGETFDAGEEDVRLGFYPFDRITGNSKLTEVLPNITIFNVVNEGKENIIVSHVGFIIRDGSGNLKVYHSTNLTDAGLAEFAEEEMSSFLDHHKTATAVGLHLSVPILDRLLKPTGTMRFLMQ